jgi:hypothetical protein
MKRLDPISLSIFSVVLHIFPDISCFGLVIIGNIMSFQHIVNIKSFLFLDTFHIFFRYSLFFSSVILDKIKSFLAFR